ncbi:MAG: hypothetical protein ACT4O5_10380 [Gammaproteobacteria bacterium]
MPVVFNDVAECVESVLRRAGPRIVLALPLGIGKPNPFANELYRRAVRDRGIELTIISALSLRKPVAGSELERRLLEPIVERVFGTYVDLEYARAARGRLAPERAGHRVLLRAGSVPRLFARAAESPQRELHARRARGDGPRRQRDRTADRPADGRQ